MNNIYLIIGASSDIGLAFINSINEDCLIIAHYNKNNKGLLEASKSIKNEIIPIHADLSKEEEINNLLNEIETNYGIPNKIIHLASSNFENIRFKDITWDDFQQCLDVSLKSLVLVLNRFLVKLAKIKTGKVIVVLSSVTLNVPPKALSHYTTTKYAMLGLIKSLANEYSDKNIQINAISPSMCETKFLDNINEKLVELNAYNHPLKRNANVQDIIPIIKMLSSSDSNYINGINIPITGGSVF